MKKSVRVSVPASSGNIGPGFDVLGLALNFRNEIEAKVVSETPGAPRIVVIGEGERTLPHDSRNIIFKTIEFVFKKAKRRVPRLELACFNRIPLARGLGSSSAAYLAGLLAGNRLLSDKFKPAQILDWATELEGHPDNVAPALYGGVRASGEFKGRVESFALPVPRLNVVVAVPSFELSTKKARAVLPKMVSLKDAVFNLSAVGLMGFALAKEPRLLKEILNDRLHEPYRAKLIPGFHTVKKAALKAGAFGSFLSGAGPTMAAFADKKRAARVGEAMRRAFASAKVRATILNLEIDRRGAIVR